MKLIEIPSAYRTANNVNRTVVLRGSKGNVESQDRGAPFIWRARVFEYSDSMMATVERLPDHQPYERFLTIEEATAFFNQQEGIQPDKTGEKTG